MTQGEVPFPKERDITRSELRFKAAVQVPRWLSSFFIFLIYFQTHPRFHKVDSEPKRRGATYLRRHYAPYVDKRRQRTRFVDGPLILFHLFPAAFSPTNKFHNLSSQFYSRSRFIKTVREILNGAKDFYELLALSSNSNIFWQVIKLETHSLYWR